MSSNLVYVNDTNWTRNGENYDIQVVFTGETAEQTITVDAVPTVGLFTYRIGSNGVYSLERATIAECAHVGQLSRVEDLLFVGGTQLNNLDEALVFDATGNEAKLASASMLSIAGQTPYGYAVVDNTTDKNVLAVYIVGDLDAVEAVEPPKAPAQLGGADKTDAAAVAAQDVDVDGNKFIVNAGNSVSSNASNKVGGLTISGWNLGKDSYVVLRFDAPAGIVPVNDGFTVEVVGGTNNSATMDGDYYVVMVLAYDSSADAGKSKTVIVHWKDASGNSYDCEYVVTFPAAGDGT